MKITLPNYELNSNLRVQTCGTNTAWYKIKIKKVYKTHSKVYPTIGNEVPEGGVEI